jgi:hypothetical protein
LYRFLRRYFAGLSSLVTLFASRDVIVRGAIKFFGEAAEAMVPLLDAESFRELLLACMRLVSGFAEQLALYSVLASEGTSVSRLDL